MFRTLFSWANGSQRCGHSHRKRETSTFRKRSLRLESLENRQLLSVSPTMNDVVLSSTSIVSQQELQNVVGENFTAAEVEQVSSNEAIHSDLWFQRPMTLENSIALSQLIQSYSSGSGLFDNIDIGISIQERSWGTGSWNAVEDGNLLWAQNEYRLTPDIIGVMPQGYGTYHTSFYYRTYNAQNQAGTWQYLDQEPYHSPNYLYTPYHAFIDDGSSAMGKMDFQLFIVFADSQGMPVHSRYVTTTDSYFRSSLNVSWSAVDGSTNAIQLGENPSANGGGQRCFPEKTSPTGSVNDTINAQISMSPAIPEGYSGDIWLRLFDPDNALALDQNDTLASNPNNQTHTPTDNYGNARLYGNDLQQVQISVSSSQNTLSIPLTILDAHAGDNYIVAAHPNEDGILQYRLNPTNGVTVERPSGNPDDPDSTYTYENVVKTEKLNVWRTLNVECDVMPYFNDPSNPCDVNFPPNPSLYLDGFVASELARACVVTSVYTPNTHQPTVSHNPMTESELLQLFGDMLDSNGLPIPNPSATPITTGRDLAMNANSADFWTVRIVMVSSYGTEDGSYFPDTNHILIRYATISTAVQNWNSNTPAQQVSQGNFMQRVILHELGHALTTGAHSSSGIMQVYQSLFEGVQQNEFTSSNLLDIQILSRIAS